MQQDRTLSEHTEDRIEEDGFPDGRDMVIRECGGHLELMLGSSVGLGYLPSDDDIYWEFAPEATDAAEEIAANSTVSVVYPGDEHYDRLVEGWREYRVDNDED